MAISLTETPETAGPSTESSWEEKEPAVLSSLNTTSFLRYGPPSGVRVVSALARFSTNSSVRARCADIPEALTESAENRLIRYFASWIAVFTEESSARAKLDATEKRNAFSANR